MIAPGFKLPAVWKSNLAFDHELPWHVIAASFEALFTQVENGIYVQRLDLFDGQGSGPTAFGQDKRPLLWNAAGLDPGNRGYFGIDPANGFRSGWANSVDVRISQELPGLSGQHKTEVALDIMNLGNLLNKNWGLIEDYGFEAKSQVAHYAGIDAESGKYVYHFTGSAGTPGIQENNSDKGNTAVSRWSVMMSVRYRF